jgi:hypothetical protein
MDPRGPLRLFRAALVTSLAVSLAVAGHVLGGGQLPDTVTLAVTAALLLAPAAWLARRQWNPCPWMRVPAHPPCWQATSSPCWPPRGCYGGARRHCGSSWHGSARWCGFPCLPGLPPPATVLRPGPWFSLRLTAGTCGTTLFAVRPWRPSRAPSTNFPAHGWSACGGVPGRCLTIHHPRCPSVRARQHP